MVWNRKPRLSAVCFQSGRSAQWIFFMVSSSVELPQPPQPLRAEDWLPKPPREVDEATFTGLLLLLS
jgi:hypothetical protein